MSSYSIKYYYYYSNCINSKGSPAIVSCAHCVKYSLSYYLLSLTNVCRNCYYKEITKCLLAHIPMLDFLKINCKLAKLEEQEDAIKAQQDEDKKVIKAL
jgi:hypothetical protein